MTTTACHIKDLHLIAPGDDNHASLIAELNDDAGLSPNESGAYTADDVLILGGDGGRDVVLWGDREVVEHSLRELLDDLEATADTDIARTPDPETKYMLDEFGNLQSDGHGIAGFETMLSIGPSREIIEAATAAPNLEVVDAATAAGMVNDRLAAILPALQDAGFDIYLSEGLGGRRTSYVHIGRLGWAGYLEASDLPGRNHGYDVSFPLKPSRAHGSGIGVWTDRADDDGIYIDAADAVDALKLACSPTTTPVIYDTTLKNLSVAGLLRRPFPPTHILPTEYRTREDQS